jgi:hypothetical protein
MKLSTILFFSMVALANYASAQAGQPAVTHMAQTSAEDEIKNLEEARNQAVVHGDGAALDRMTSDDYTLHHAKRRDAHQSGDSQRLCVRVIPLRIAPDFRFEGTHLWRHRNCDRAFDPKGNGER